MEWEKWKEGDWKNKISSILHRELLIHNYIHEWGKPLTGLGIQEGYTGCQKSRHSHRGHELAVAVVGGQGHGALAQVGEALRQPHHEEVVGVLRVVLSQLSQHGSQSEGRKFWVIELACNLVFAFIRLIDKSFSDPRLCSALPWPSDRKVLLVSELILY